MDLGNSQAPNLLLDPDMLQYALNPSDDFNRQPKAILGGLGTGSHALDWFRYEGISPPGQPETSIYTQYICSAPKKKSIPTILLLVMVADYVLFQLWWLVFKFFADIHYSGKSPTANYCQGCSIARGHELIDIGTVDGIPTRGSGTKDYVRLLEDDGRPNAEP